MELEIRALLDQWKEAEAEARQAKKRLQEAIDAAWKAGTTDAELMRWTGVARSTVRRWRGEPS